MTWVVSDDLALTSGYNPKREEVGLILVLALVVAVGIKAVGALLITAMLIIPAASARPHVRSPEAMVLLSAVIAAVSAFGGLKAAFWLDTPAGPSIVCMASLVFAGSMLLSLLTGRDG